MTDKEIQEKKGAREVLDAIRDKGVYVGGVVGTSMLPMLRQGKDKVMIKKPCFPLKKFDVPLYTNYDHITLHRIVRVRRDGSYVICGDNRKSYEVAATSQRIDIAPSDFLSCNIEIGSTKIGI